MGLDVNLGTFLNTLTNEIVKSEELTMNKALTDHLVSMAMHFIRRGVSYLSLCTVMKHHDLKHLREERVYLLHTPTLQSSEEVRAGTQGRNLETGTEAEARRGAAYWLTPHSLLSLLSYTPRTTCPEVALPTVS